ncbi:response regulator [bacterium]|nr:response regulator [bacterium]
MPRRAVVCDDDKLFLRWISRLLTEWGWTVETAQSIDLALILLKRDLPDLLDLDLRCGAKSEESGRA